MSVAIEAGSLFTFHFYFLYAEKFAYSPLLHYLCNMRIIAVNSSNYRRLLLSVLLMSASLSAFAESLVEGYQFGALNFLDIPTPLYIVLLILLAITSVTAVITLVHWYKQRRNLKELTVTASELTAELAHRDAERAETAHLISSLREELEGSRTKYENALRLLDKVRPETPSQSEALMEHVAGHIRTLNLLAEEYYADSKAERTVNNINRRIHAEIEKKKTSGFIHSLCRALNAKQAQCVDRIFIEYPDLSETDQLVIILDLAGLSASVISLFIGHDVPYCHTKISRLRSRYIKPLGINPTELRIL